MLPFRRRLVDRRPRRLTPRYSRRTLLGVLLATVLVPGTAAQAQVSLSLIPPDPVKSDANLALRPVSGPSGSASEIPDPVDSAPESPAIDRISHPFRAWYFAEGNSRNGFDTYFTLLNLSDQPASVSALYNR